jgi:hypothetical protein
MRPPGNIVLTAWVMAGSFFVGRLPGFDHHDVVLSPINAPITATLNGAARRIEPPLARRAS